MNNNKYKLPVNEYGNTDGIPIGWTQTNKTTAQLHKLNVPYYKAFAGWNKNGRYVKPKLVNIIPIEFTQKVENYVSQHRKSSLPVSITTARMLFKAGIINEEDIDEVAELYERNRETKGSAYRVLVAWRRGEASDEEAAEILGRMSIANKRHTETDYDLVDKRGLSEEQIRQVRSSYDAKIR